MSYCLKTLSGAVLGPFHSVVLDGDKWLADDLVIPSSVIGESVVDEFKPANIIRTTEEIENIISSKIELLWKAADSYTSKYISGVAIGILTLGVIQQKPKALAVSAWSSSVWDMYYTRKALVTADSVNDLDFSSTGAMPFTVPELKAEIGL